jgi:hypothetical protein
MHRSSWGQITASENAIIFAYLSRRLAVKGPDTAYTCNYRHQKSPLPKRRSEVFATFTLQPRYRIHLGGLKPEALRPSLSVNLSSGMCILL